jgi:hypothetical protein
MGEAVAGLALIVFALWCIVKFLPWIAGILCVILLICLIAESVEGRKGG